MLTSMIDLDEKEPYRIEPDGPRFKITDWEENVALLCSDRPSAEQYAVLMNQAFRRGYKVGYRKARTARPS